MRRKHYTIIVISFLLLGTVWAAGPTTAPSDEIVYKPPKRGAPAARVGGGSRGGTSVPIPVLAVLLPDQLAYTTREQPALYWFSSDTTKVKCEISITDMSTLDTVYESSLDGVATPGIQKLDLAKENVKLKPGVQYQWLVAFAPDPTAPSANVDAGGFLMRIPQPEGLQAKLAGTDAMQKASVEAGEGLWFDALDDLMADIEANPKDSALHQKLSHLLQQVNLKEAAEYEAKQ